MTWNDITIGKYIEIIDVLKQDIPEMEKTMKMVGIAAGKNIRQIKIEEAKDLMEQFQELKFDQIPHKIITKWRNYRITNRVEHMNAYQMTKTLELSDISNLHIILALLARPKRKWFTKVKEETEEDIKERAVLFYNEMPITIAYGNWVFFWKVSKALENGIKPFSRTMQHLKKMNPMDLLNIGDGT